MSEQVENAEAAEEVADGTLAQLVRPWVNAWKSAMEKYDLLLAKARVLAKRISGLETNAERRTKLVDELAKDKLPDYVSVGSYFGNMLLQLRELDQDSDELILTLDYLAGLSGIWRNWCSELLDDRLSGSETPAAEVPAELTETHAEMRELKKEMAALNVKIEEMGPGLKATDRTFFDEFFRADKKSKLETPKGKLPGQVSSTKTLRRLHMTLTLSNILDPEDVIEEYALDDGPLGYQWSYLLRKLTADHRVIPMTPRLLANYVEVADIEFAEWEKALMTTDGGYILGKCVRAEIVEPQEVSDEDAEEEVEDESSEDEEVEADSAGE